MILGSVFFNHIDSLDYGVHTTNAGVYDAPRRLYEQITVAGRNGALLQDRGLFENIKVTYPAFIYENFDLNLLTYRNILTSSIGYKRLEDTYHPEEYRLAVYDDSLTMKSIKSDSKGSFELVFNCKPQRFMKFGEIPTEVSSGDVFHNPYGQVARPNIRVYGSGTMQFGDVYITVLSNSYQYIDINSELGDAYNGTHNCNNLIVISSDDFPVLGEGDTQIEYDGFTKVEMTPNWWRL